MDEAPRPATAKPAPGGVLSGAGFRLGRILGLEVTLDASWLVIFALVTFSLATGFGAQHPGSDPAVRWLAAFAASLAFFASILLHEMSHSWVARLRGLGVHGITLFIFGGVSRLKEEPRRPRDEFVIAVVGPLMSGALGGLFLLARRAAPADTLLVSALGWLGAVNLLLAVFNLLPGFPLDGGRIFRAVVWAFTGNLRKATRAAARGGAAIAYGLMLWGAYTAFVAGQLVNGLWLGFIGWFLLSASQKTVAQMELRSILGSLRVSQALRPDCAVAGPEETVARFVDDQVLRTAGRCAFVSDGGALLGLVTLHELRKVAREAWPSTRLGDVMVPFERLRRVAPDDTLLTALERMNEGPVNQLPVLEGRSLLGIVTREDVLRFVALHLELGRDGGVAGPTAS